MRDLALWQRVLVIEVALLSGVILLYLGLAAYWSLRQFLVTRALGRSRDLLAAAAAGDAAHRADLRALRSLPDVDRLLLLSGFAGSVSGSARMRLAALAESAGLTARAERLCRSRWWWRRLIGVRLLAAAGTLDPGLIGILLRDPSAQIRAEAAIWAGAERALSLVAHLLAMLGDPSAGCRFAAKNALIRLGGAASEAIAGYLAAEQAGVAEALEVAAAAPHPEYLRPALRLASSAQDELRTRAAELLGSLGGDEATACLSQMLTDSEAKVRAAAARSLGRLVHWAAAPQLAQALRDQTWEVRREAAQALAALGGVGQLYLQRALGEEDRFAADMARQVLGPTSPGESP